LNFLKNCFNAMTPKQRLNRILERKPTDRIAWTTLVDDVSRSVMDEPYRTMDVLDFYRAIGCDIALFGNYGLPEELVVQSPCKLILPCVETPYVNLADGSQETRLESDWGLLTRRIRNGHSIKYPVETILDARLLKKIWLNARYEEATGINESYSRLEQALGNDGIYVQTLGPSVIQHLIEYEMGMVNFYGLLNEYPGEMEELFDVMHERRKQEYEIVARLTPASAVMSVENTSSNLISPSLYRKYSVPQLKNLADIAHRHGKLLILHMCGRLKALLDGISGTNFDALNAVTPPPFGDVEFEEILDRFGEDCILWGAIFNGEVFQSPAAGRNQLWKELDRIFTPRLRRANVLLWLPADGLPTPVERFLWVKEWMEKNGAK